MEWSTVRICWRNLGRSKRRTALALAAIAIGQFALLSTSGLMNGYADSLRSSITGPMIGHLQIHHPDWREERAVDLYLEDIHAVMETVRQDEAVASASARIYAPVLVAPERDAYTAMVLGVNIEAESSEYGLLAGLEGGLAPHEVLVGYRLARRTGAEVGDEIAVIGQGADGSLANDLYTVKSIIRGPADIVNQNGVVMSLEDAQRLLYMPGQAHEIIVRTNKSGQADPLAGRLRNNEMLSGLEVMPWREIVPELVRIIQMTGYISYLILVLIFVAAIAGIANTLMMATFERMHEFGMLLALGTRPARLVRMIMVEAVLLGVLGVVVGTLLGMGLIYITADSGIDLSSWGGDEIGELSYQGLELPLLIYPRLEVSDALLGLVAVFFTSLIAAMWPAWVAGNLEPIEAMRR